MRTRRTMLIDSLSRRNYVICTVQQGFTSCQRFFSPDKLTFKLLNLCIQKLKKHEKTQSLAEYVLT